MKVLDDSGSGSDSDVIAGLDWIFERSKINAENPLVPPIRVVNLSLGRPVEGDILDAPLHTAFENLSNPLLVPHSIAVVVSAGNEPGKEAQDFVPAGFPEVMAVASTTALDGINQCKRFAGFVAADTASYFTTDGALIVRDTFGTVVEGVLGVTVSAPGEKQEDISKRCTLSAVGILSTQLGGGTTRKFGTSMAAPHVAGIVARMYEQDASELGLTIETIRTALRSNAGAEVPIDSPSTAYSFDGEREGVALAPQSPTS